MLGRYGSVAEPLGKASDGDSDDKKNRKGHNDGNDVVVKHVA